eukprot:CAMPEP_0175133808 /NCGR_PEP_ID=MMETSP0087-20121206/7842_1 /TAXON_ID=136419 /ORGANISM="Unknown Unknown, Strain D1" /LENGTH=647 /DNA_ID=CAMNT_0016416327 /DNA_START=211 /DNA_END=2154 /DNA_ORIENTATION=+
MSQLRQLRFLVECTLTVQVAREAADLEADGRVKQALAKATSVDPADIKLVWNGSNSSVNGKQLVGLSDDKLRCLKLGVQISLSERTVLEKCVQSLEPKLLQQELRSAHESWGQLKLSLEQAPTCFQNHPLETSHCARAQTLGIFTPPSPRLQMWAKEGKPESQRNRAKRLKEEEKEEHRRWLLWQKVVKKEVRNREERVQKRKQELLVRAKQRLTKTQINEFQTKQKYLDWAKQLKRQQRPQTARAASKPQNALYGCMFAPWQLATFSGDHPVVQANDEKQQKVSTWDAKGTRGRLDGSNKSQASQDSIQQQEAGTDEDVGEHSQVEPSSETISSTNDSPSNSQSRAAQPPQSKARIVSRHFPVFPKYQVALLTKQLPFSQNSKQFSMRANVPQFAKNWKSKGKSIGMPRNSTIKERMDREVPGPGAYEVKSSLGGTSNAFGKSPKWEQCERDSVTGSFHHAVVSRAKATPKLRQKFQEPAVLTPSAIEQSPGPGSYEVLSFIDQPSPSTATFGQSRAKQREGTTQPVPVPGPGTYNSASFVDESTPSSAFGRSQYQKNSNISRINKAVIQSPGPGTYDPGFSDSTYSSSPSAKMVGKVDWPRDLAGMVPGGGHYMVPSSIGDPSVGTHLPEQDLATSRKSDPQNAH